MGTMLGSSPPARSATRSDRAPAFPDALASASEQFGLGRPPGLPAGLDSPSARDVRPWGLRGLVRPEPISRHRSGLRYDPGRQLLVGADGRPVLEDRDDGPSADSVSDYDGDEGKSEDWKYDFAPDHPLMP